MKIAVYTIAKNEEKHVARWAESCKDADYQLILDTGSTDRTIAVANEYGVVAIKREFEKFKFDEARNMALSLLPDDVDLCISLDMDEILLPGWRKHLELMHGSNMVTHKIVTTFNEDGSEGQSFTIGRVHGRHSHQWKYPIHEVLSPIVEENSNYCAGLTIHHLPDNSKSRSQYLQMLKDAAADNQNDERLQFYLAREYYFHGKYTLSQYHFNRHLAIGRWKPERASSHRYLASMRPEAREYHLYRALSEDANRRETWVELAKYYYEVENWSRCRMASAQALEITKRPTDYFCEAEAWGYLPHDLMAISSYHMGDYDIALTEGCYAVAMEPNNQRLKDNLEWYKLKR